jgi:16S rRNA (uracil1498-N3)-methyltransferase
VPFAAARSVTQWTGARGGAHLDRLRRVAREAAMQCRRAWLPEIAAASTFDEVRALPGAVLADVGGAPPDLERTTVLVGPVGGWSEDERACQLPRMALGAHVLRAETAAMTAAALLAALRSGLLGSTR